MGKRKRRYKTGADKYLKTKTAKAEKRFVDFFFGLYLFIYDHKNH